MAYIGKSPGTGVRNRFIYTATAAQTTFSGSDDHSRTLSYTDAEFMDVFLNGVKLDKSDYTATSGTSIVLGSGATAGDNLEVLAFDTFSVFSGEFSQDVTVGADLTVDTDTLVVDSTNNRVGIGTTSPTRNLHVNSGTGDVVARFESTDADAYVNFVSSGGEALVGSSGNDLVFYPAGTEEMRVTDSGNVGIGTSSPSHSLDIQGATNGDITQRIKNSTAGTSARAGIFFDADDGNKMAAYATSSAYTGVGSWQDAGLISTSSAASGGLIMNAQGGDIKFQRALTEKVRITSSGLTFNGDTAAANALDDYEEGTWTPVYSASTTSPTVSYAEQHGEYVKIGRQVIARCELKTNSVSGGSGIVTVGGLPFTSVSNDGTRAGSVIIAYSTSFSVDNPQTGYHNQNTTSVVLGHNSINTNSNSPLSGTLDVSNLATGSNSNFLMATIIYTAA